jgi:hypothetical protein
MSNDVWSALYSMVVALTVRPKVRNLLCQYDRRDIDQQ